MQLGRARGVEIAERLLCRVSLVSHSKFYRTYSSAYGSDTGYKAHEEGPSCPAFKQIAKIYGPFEVAFIPIWRGGALGWLSKLGLRVGVEVSNVRHDTTTDYTSLQLRPDCFLRRVHCTPSDAVDVHRNVSSKLSIAIHHSTFIGNIEESRWSLGLLREACGLLQGGEVKFARGAGEIGTLERDGSTRFAVLDVGESVLV